ncbi:hypothetical protein KC19_6G108500 [Ceratodon purpureus]|uniref:Uncharacterized protein n=1 Tax=Ceratodon purpureus TaxID=3225 RepID=A0A8T0HDS9_CERPU|nr:hypothetical protein KC19_6G108500 [Ceratodon purpureus]
MHSPQPQPSMQQPLHTWPDLFLTPTPTPTPTLISPSSGAPGTNLGSQGSEGSEGSGGSGGVSGPKFVKEVSNGGRCGEGAGVYPG